jgi:hypothetical protein
MQDSDYRLAREPHIGSEWLRLRLNEPLAALLALVPLNLVSALPGLHRFDSARMAGHVKSPVEVSQRKAG